MEWTRAQKDTIETRGKNILVSAAAGSGKTAVLIERIKQLVTEDKVDIDRFLITTFTNAAAAEMKSRLEKAIEAQMAEPGADVEFLGKQLSLIPGANISTFHTFALEVMRRYFYLTDLEPGFKIGDDVEVSIMKNEAVDRLFEDRFENDNEAFTGFLRKYSGDRNDDRIKKNIVSLYNEMRSIPDYMEWAERSTELLNGESPAAALGLDVFVYDLVKDGLARAVEMYGEAAELLEAAGIDSICEKAYNDAEKVEKVAQALGEPGTVAERLEKCRSSMETLKFNTMRASKDQQEDYETIKERVSSLRKSGKKILDDIKKKYFARRMEEYDRELKELYEDTAYLTGLLGEFESVFREMKAERNIVDFDDVMHYAIDILRNDMAADEYRDKFRYIFIDEFQDSNMLQETIVGRISREDNLFMVGDVKQSIYKFRLAEPEIFKRKYRQYSEGGDENSIKIDLSSNFRSKFNVTETVNRVFDSVMDDYDENARLRCSIDREHPGMRSEYHIAVAAGYNGDMDADPEKELVAELIRECLGKRIYDVKGGITREVEYRDIVVLSRSRSSIGSLEKFLNDRGIPAYGENTGGYFETVEVQVFVNILRVIDNTRQDIPLISVMRSPVFDFDVRELAAIRIAEREGSFYDAVRAFSCRETEGDGSGAEERLAAKVRNMFDTISYWKELRNTVTLEELTRILLYDTGYFDYCSGLPAGNRRISNLRLLVEKAGQFEQGSHSGLYGFISYIEAMKKNNISVGEAKMLGEGENVVRVMTVHKSKGLEFPVVILTGTGRKIRHRGAGSGTIMHKDLALGMPHVNIEEKWHRKTLLQRAIEDKKAAEEYEEEIRILYVAMTRAMDHLILTGTVKDPEKLESPADRPDSFMGMVYGSMRDGEDIIAVHDEEQAVAAEMTDIMERVVADDVFGESANERDDEFMKLIDERLSYVYPYEDAAGLRSKYSVTELSNAGKREQSGREGVSEGGPAGQNAGQTELMRPAFSMGEPVLTAAQKGTAMHLVMEKLDFRKAVSSGSGYIAEVAEKLRGDGMLTDGEFKAINVENIAAFFRHDVGMRAAGAEKLYKEREFISCRQMRGTEVIVQGVIDCYFEEDGGIVLIDYKNSHMATRSEEEIVETYADQIKQYGRALEEACHMPVREAYLYLFESGRFVPVKM